MPVYDDEKTEAQRLRDITGIGPEAEQAMEDQARAGAREDSKAANAKDLDKAERKPADTLGKGFTDKDNGRTLRGRLAGFAKSRRGKQALIGSGLAGLLLGGGIGMFSIISGPAQFAQAAEWLKGAHFSHQTDAADGRFGKMVRWLNNGHDIGATRLSFMENKYRKNFMSQMKDAGFEVRFDERTGYFKDILIDTTNERSPYHGMSNDEVKTSLEREFGTKKVSIAQYADGKFRVNPDSFFGSAERNSFRVISKKMGASGLTTWVRGRILSKYGVTNFHPTSLADKWTNQKAIDWAKSLKEFNEKRKVALKEGAGTTTIDTSGAAEEDENGTKKPVGGGSSTADSSSFKETLESLKASKGVKVTGGVAAVAAIACAAKTVHDNAGAIKYAQDIVPMERMSMELISMGGQIAAGEDLNTEEMSFLAQNFTTKDAKGNVTSSWDQAKPYQAYSGHTGGVDMDEGLQETLGSGTPSWLDWTNSAAVGALCSTAGTIIAGGISVAIGIFTGGTVSTVTGLIAGAVAGPLIIDKLSEMLAGDAVNVLAQGAEYGNLVDYGARYSANTVAIASGGVALTSSQVAVLDQQSKTIQRDEFQSKSLASRLFDPYDSRSLVGSMIPSLSRNTNITALAQGFGRMGSALATLPSKLFTGRAFADSQPYQYPFPEYGFSESDLNNSLVDNPYDNANKVAVILDQNGQGDTPRLHKQSAGMLWCPNHQG